MSEPHQPGVDKGSDVDVTTFEVMSWLVLACVAGATAAVAILFGVPAAAVLLMIVAGAGAMWWWKARELEEPPRSP